MGENALLLINLDDGASFGKPLKRYMFHIVDLGADELLQPEHMGSFLVTLV